MADMILKVSSDEVRTKAGEIETQKAMMQTLMEEMQSKVNLLADYWQSQSGQDYTTKYQNITRNINGSLETLMGHIRNLNDAAQRYEEIENNQVQKTQSLSTNNIF